MRRAASLKIDHVTKRFGGVIALNDVSFDVTQGEIHGLIGPNGAGKTTLFNLITGIYSPTEGKIELNGRSLVGMSPHQTANLGIARTFQNIRLFNEMTVLDNVKVGLHNQIKYGMWTGILRLPAYKEKEHEMNREAMKLLKIFDLDREAHYKASQLPYGKQRKLEIARALATNPKLLLLDEHTAALDPKTALKVLTLSAKIVEENHLTTMMITHNMKDAIKYGNRLIMMHEGHIIYDVSGEEKKNLQVSDLLAKFQIASGGEFANDRMILS